MSIKTITGAGSGEQIRIALVVSRFNAEVTEGLLRGALGALKESGVNDDHITVVEAPGAFEIPLVLEWVAMKGNVEAMVALGAVIKGETSHYEHISEAAMRGIRSVSLKYHIPIGCGVLTTFTDEQALERSADNGSNKGREAALAAIEMIHLKRLL
ncbi:MAG TPA: 6,7-dimethyl-8-ribityllumazine synthase [Candidatus Kapabacteria bacterium]|nr:6,7-dimethyl-8-ribityllumazine synthase [Candidatus Kapabacteria bacterium]